MTALRTESYASGSTFFRAVSSRNKYPFTLDGLKSGRTFIAACVSLKKLSSKNPYDFRSNRDVNTPPTYLLCDLENIAIVDTELYEVAFQIDPRIGYVFSHFEALIDFFNTVPSAKKYIDYLFEHKSVRDLIRTQADLKLFLKRMPKTAYRILNRYPWLKTKFKGGSLGDLLELVVVDPNNADEIKNLCADSIDSIQDRKDIDELVPSNFHCGAKGKTASQLRDLILERVESILAENDELEPDLFTDIKEMLEQISDYPQSYVILADLFRKQPTVRAPMLRLLYGDQYPNYIDRYEQMLALFPDALDGLDHFHLKLIAEKVLPRLYDELEENDYDAAIRLAEVYMYRLPIVDRGDILTFKFAPFYLDVANALVNEFNPRDPTFPYESKRRIAQLRIEYQERLVEYSREFPRSVEVKTYDQLIEMDELIAEHGRENLNYWLEEREKWRSVDRESDTTRIVKVPLTEEERERYSKERYAASRQIARDGYVERYEEPPTEEEKAYCTRNFLTMIRDCPFENVRRWALNFPKVGKECASAEMSPFWDRKLDELGLFKDGFSTLGSAYRQVMGQWLYSEYKKWEIIGRADHSEAQRILDKAIEFGSAMAMYDKNIHLFKVVREEGKLERQDRIKLEEMAYQLMKNNFTLGFVVAGIIYLNLANYFASKAKEQKINLQTAQNYLHKVFTCLSCGEKYATDDRSALETINNKVNPINLIKQSGFEFSSWNQARFDILVRLGFGPLLETMFPSQNASCAEEVVFPLYTKGLLQMNGQFGPDLPNPINLGKIDEMCRRVEENWADMRSRADTLKKAIPRSVTKSHDNRYSPEKLRRDYIEALIQVNKNGKLPEQPNPAKSNRALFA